MADSTVALGAGSLVVWLALAAYLARLWRGQRRVSERIDRLEQERGGSSG